MQFASLVKATAKASGYSALPLFSVPADFETLPEEEIYKITEDRLDEFVSKIAKISASAQGGR